MQRSILDFATSNIVLCPICNQDINHLDIRGRTDHVDTCLVRVTFVEIPPKVELPRITNTPTPPIKKRKVELKYVNGDIDTNKPAKIIKPPTSIKATNKKPIPELKTLTFPPDYKIAVDAFNYAPHDEIDQYFLTHFHADHYGGISKKWAYERVFGLDDSDYENRAKYKKIIYCTGITGRLLTLRYSIDPRFIKHLELDTRYKIKDFTSDDFVDDFGEESNDETPGLYVIPICANHCPGAAIFLFESIDINNQKHTILHCGDFRVNEDILHHPSLRKYSISEGSTPTLLDKVYLDTTYLSSKHNLPKQTLVCETMANLFEDLSKKTSSNSLFATWFGVLTQSRITDFWKSGPKIKKKKFLIVIGTYIIGKEKLALAISKRLNCLIYVSSIGARKDKYDIFKAYQDEYLESVLTDDEYGGGDEHDCVIHLVPMTLMCWSMSHGLEF
ncbi:hypothetical protein G210_3091 [Candida maltosa Xu316]|uniref:UBZ4-type domain-containing protein n=1 Tax=Candida maltosa (strain Xu316) TaxID=1245528 RepID=M3J3Z4_CANMX|nr:hypothetical protein G210_3091 [Candida maltosa Xu316]